MADKIFQKNNVNDSIFTIESEEGGTPDDHYNASIGDATLKHISELQGGRIAAWDYFVKMPDGNLFAIEDNLTWNDTNELNIRSKDDLGKFMKDAKIPEKYRPIYEEAMQNELDKETQSEDAMDQRDNLVSYEDWEASPGLSSHWDIPQTPKPHVKYVGNCRQMFYDDFPEDHPDSSFINGILMMMNRDIDDISPRFIYSVGKRIEDANVLASTKQHLLDMVHRIGETNENPEDVASSCLRAIDRDWAVVFYRAAKQLEMKNDPIYQYLNTATQQFAKEIKGGVSINKVYSLIKQMGKTFFSMKNPLRDKGIEGRLKKRHWILYHKMKQRFAPLVPVNGIDLNRAYRSELVKALGVSFDTAKAIIIKRPFESLEELRRTGLVSLDSVARQNPILVEFLDKIEEAAASALEARDVKLITCLPAQFIKQQKLDNKGIPQEEWQKVWECYNVRKASVMKALK